MKRYEVLVVLHNPPTEDGIKAAIDRLTDDINAAGGRVETVQKMDRKPFARITDRKVTSGFYVNMIFQAPASAIDTLRTRFAAHQDVFRTALTHKAKANALEAAAAS